MEGIAVATHRTQRWEIVNTALEPLPLVRLSDTRLALAREADDIRGKVVLDDAGYEMGRVEDLVIDHECRRVYFMILRASGFIPGEKQLLIPVDTIRKREGDHVYVDQDHERVAAGPEYDPALVSDPGYQAGVYGWYGFVPYWHPSFVSPAGCEVACPSVEAREDRPSRDQQDDPQQWSRQDPGEQRHE